MACHARFSAVITTLLETRRAAPQAHVAWISSFSGAASLPNSVAEYDYACQLALAKRHAVRLVDVWSRLKSGELRRGTGRESGHLDNASYATLAVDLWRLIEQRRRLISP